MIKFNLDVKPVWVRGDIEDFNPTEIGDYSEKERASIKLKLSPIFPGKQRDLRKANTHQEFASEVMDAIMQSTKNKNKFKDTPKNRKMVTEVLKTAGVGVKERFDEEGFNRDLIDEAIVDWEGIKDQNNKKIPCTRENKINLFYDGGYSNMGIVILGIASRLAIRHDLYEKEKEKNFGSSQDGKP